MKAKQNEKEKKDTRNIKDKFEEVEPNNEEVD
jgi:hypothetical protein